MQGIEEFLSSIAKVTAELLPFTMVQNTFAIQNEGELGSVVVPAHIGSVVGDSFWGSLWANSV
jgi:hypothetical protein